MDPYLPQIRKTYLFTNIVVTATPVRGGTEVVIQYGSHAAAPLAQRFMAESPTRPANGRGKNLPGLTIATARALADVVWCIYKQR